ncbi:hypothetical protein COY95_01780 [Candidatus Woesearchaeota archaeon CG_4_10_14_0_8_um_filter_47_5]|nr:MAG: hypothetical protein COY95_01780 [Candidatus Woesearchaeota archaeon CG_4_10_14_0_8_um_filter_47_5]
MPERGRGVVKALMWAVLRVFLGVFFFLIVVYLILGLVTGIQSASFPDPVIDTEHGVLVGWEGENVSVVPGDFAHRDELYHIDQTKYTNSIGYSPYLHCSYNCRGLRWKVVEQEEGKTTKFCRCLGIASTSSLSRERVLNFSYFTPHLMFEEGVNISLNSTKKVLWAIWSDSDEEIYYHFVITGCGIVEDNDVRAHLRMSFVEGNLTCFYKEEQPYVSFLFTHPHEQKGHLISGDTYVFPVEVTAHALPDNLTKALVFVNVTVFRILSDPAFNLSETRTLFIHIE